MVRIECPSCVRVFDEETENHVADGDYYTCPKCKAEISVSMDWDDAEEEDDDEGDD